MTNLEKLIECLATPFLDAKTVAEAGRKNSVGPRKIGAPGPLVQCDARTARNALSKSPRS